MRDINFSKLTWENLPARTTALSATNLNRIENGIADSVNGVNSNSHSIAELQTRISQIANGSPTPVATAAEMTDESAVYLYTGSETGYTAGNWYYYNGTAWTSGGTYGGAVTDTTLSISGAAADAKAVGDALADKADSSDVDALDTRVTAVEGDVSDLTEDFSQVTEGLYGYASYTDFITNNGKRWGTDGSLIDNSSTNADEFSVSGGDMFLLTGQNINRPGTNIIRYLMSDNTISNSAVTNPDSGYVIDYAVTVPAGAIKMLVTRGISYAFSAKKYGLLYSAKGYTDEAIAPVSAKANAVESEINGIGEYVYQYEDVTKDFTLVLGQAYGTVGQHIETSSTASYKHVRIPKSAGIEKIKFGAVYNNSNISSYIQYVDDNDIVVSRAYVQGEYTPGKTYEYKLNYPEGATGVYVTGGQVTSTYGSWVLNIYKLIPLDVASLITDVEKKKINDYNDVVLSICRIADGLSVPQQSIIGYKTAYKNGFRIMLCDLQFTHDGVPVLWHDLYLNQYSNTVYDENGQLVDTTNPVYIADTDYEDLLDYDFGLYKGEIYAGTKILTLEAMLNLCKQLGCVVFIEQKVTPTTEQYNTAFALIRQYGMEEKVVWNPQTTSELSALITYEPNVYICLHTNLGSGALTDAMVTAIVSAVNNYNQGHVWILISTSATMTAIQMETLSAGGVKLAIGTPSTKNDLLTYYSKGKPYTAVDAVLSNTLIAGKILHDNVMN